MKSKSHLLTLAIVILATCMVFSTNAIPTANAKIWHSTTLSFEFPYPAPIDQKSTKLMWENTRYKSYTEELHFDDICIVVMIIYDKTKDTGQILSINYQDSGNHLCFIGMKGTMYYDGAGPVDIFQINGVGIGSYGLNSHFGNAIVKGTINLQDMWGYSYPYDQHWAALNVNLAVTYLA